MRRAVNLLRYRARFTCSKRLAQRGEGSSDGRRRLQATEATRDATDSSRRHRRSIVACAAQLAPGDVSRELASAAYSSPADC